MPPNESRTVENDEQSSVKVVKKKAKKKNLTYVETCYLCDAPVTLKTIKNHIEYEHMNLDGSFECGGSLQSCKVKFTEYLKFYGHIYRQHQKNLSKCRKCGFLFSLESSLNVHVKRFHARGKTLTPTAKSQKNMRMCLLCHSERPMAYNSLQEHMESCHKNADCQFVCQRSEKACCKQNFTEYKKFYHHVFYTHRNQSFVCKRCGCGFNSAAQLLVHQKIHKNDPADGWKCNLCDVQNSRKCPSFKDHMENCHKNSENQYVCGGNKKSCTPFIDYLRFHLHVSFYHHDRSYQCLLCDRKFKQKWNLAVHKKTHAENAATETIDGLKVCRLCKVQVGESFKDHANSCHKDKFGLFTIDINNLSARKFEELDEFCHYIQDSVVVNNNIVTVATNVKGVIPSEIKKTCQLCLQQYTSFQRHANQCHKKENRFFVCKKDCKRKCISYKAFYEHVRIKHGGVCVKNNLMNAEKFHFGPKLLI